MDLNSGTAESGVPGTRHPSLPALVFWIHMNGLESVKHSLLESINLNICFSLRDRTISINNVLGWQSAAQAKTRDRWRTVAALTAGMLCTLGIH
eukprot:jgi/Chrzof1/10693/Cz05g09020.t1